MVGQWTSLTNQPSFNAGTMLLLTDGTVLCHDSGANEGGTSNWYKLSPDQYGSYLHGIWSNIASGPNSPLYFASAVLKDGRVFVAGGEYNSGQQVELLAGEIYDPISNSWTKLSTPAGWTEIGDAPCCVLPDGRVLLGAIENNSTAIYDPITNTWTPAANKINIASSEESWTLLPDETVLTVDCHGHPETEKYIIPSNTWVTAGSTPSDLVEDSSKEIGPAILLPDGRVFAVGATGATALYTMPAIANQVGSWTNGPAFPTQNGQKLIAKDAPGCLLPNGKVLCTASPASGCDKKYEGFCPPTYFFEFDPISGTLMPAPAPLNSDKPVYTGRMLLLPTGEVLFSNGTLDIELYTPEGIPNPSWRPQITSSPPNVQPGQTYTLYGRQLNGLSQAVSYGDDASMATNYPIIRINNISSNKQTYCRTHDHSSMGVHTGSVIHSTRFTVPNSIESGKSLLTVIANGIPSEPFQLTVS
jgi:Kelch motif protein